ncbi:17357_t:CDS:2 [Gigaspora rosea]|nr:17357_t:CDS:2 [Gigaspora rosea]
MCLCPFFEKYGLLGCETKESQTKRHANSEKSKSRLQLYHTFFSELVQIQMHLEEYSLCKIHYNQLIASDFLRQLLLNSNLPSTSNRHGKRKVSNKFAEEQAHTEPAVTVEIDVCNSLQANKQTNEVAVQVSNETHKIGVQVSDNMLHTLEAHINLLQLQLNLKINEVEDLKKQLEYAYDYVIESWDHELVVEKNDKFNTIDMTIKNQKGTGSHSKWCKKCNTTNIDNKKRTCPNCNEKLDTLAVLQAESANELTQINTASQSKSLVIKSYTFTHEQNRPNFDYRPSYRGLPQKTNAELLEILQSIRDLHNNQNELENEIESEN